MSRGRLWTEEEDELLTRFYGKYAAVDLANDLQRTVSAIKNRALHKGLQIDRELWKKNPVYYGNREVWLQGDIDYIEANYITLGAVAVGEELGRTALAIHCKAKRLGLKKNHSWTKAELADLRKMYADYDGHYCAEHFGVSFQSILSTCQMYGIAKNKMWQPEELELLAKLYKVQSKEHCAIDLDCSLSVVRCAIKKYNMRK